MIYAIVEIAGKQCKVSKKQWLYIPKLPQEVGTLLYFHNVLLTDNGNGSIAVGTPIVEGVSITARIIEHTKGDKVIIFKKKRRKGYKLKKGHRQDYTKILIEDIESKDITK